MKALNLTACTAATPSSSATRRRGNRTGGADSAPAAPHRSFPLTFPAGGVWLDPKLHLSSDVVYGQVRGERV